MIDIQTLRARLGKSQSDFAEMLGVDQSTVSRWENGESQPSGPALRLLELLSEQPRAQKSKSKDAA